jgi:hypothetical protein
MKRYAIILIIMAMCAVPTTHAQEGDGEDDSLAFSVAESTYCFYRYDEVFTWVTSLENIESSIDNLINAMSGHSVSVTISNDPFGLARGIILLMSDVAWVQILLTFFILAFTTIVILMIIRTVRSLWGPVKEFILPLIKLIPGVG